MTIQEYIKNINQQYKTGNATEHTYRGDLKSLISDICKKVLVTNEPKRIDCGAPDYIITKNKIPVGYIEAKDIATNLSDKKYKEQFDRYKKSLDNLIITDFLSFELFINGIFISRVSIAEVQGNKIAPKPENFDAFTDFIQSFCDYQWQPIKSSQKLAHMMASKARILTSVIERAVVDDEEKNIESDIRNQMLAFDKVLINGIKAQEFADIYSQTIAYGMFVARLHDETQQDFTRFEAANLIPKSNPFLRQLFQHIAGYDLDTRIDWVIDALADVFKAADTNEILKEFEKSSQDPVIHFYETFLSEYNPVLRKSRGVYYTPAPVVKFIVGAVDDILKNDFGIASGLADTAKTKIKVKDNGVNIEKEVHKVQILDPATGTGTFLAEVVSKIYKSFEGQEGMWSDYVDKHLIPRLNGFEILMASYAMAHLKLDLLLNQTGYIPTEQQKRLRVYLTNSLQEYHPDTGTLFASWLSREANEANHIKRDTPVMVVLGNPPYSGHSSNKSKWIEDLLADYKQEPGGGKLKEKNPKWLNDDYVKFIRFGEYFIEKNSEGVLAFINNHSFLDNPTFRGMRWNLLKTFDKIYIIDLHGNTKKKETCSDGSKDENVFDIQQGVSVNIFIKTGKKKKNKLAEVHYKDLYGLREDKYDFLLRNNLNDIDFKQLELPAPSYCFVQKNFDMQKIYSRGFSVTDLFHINSVGIFTANDSLFINTERNELEKNIAAFSDSLDTSKVESILYRPFDNRWIYFDTKMLERSRERVMNHFLFGQNLGLIVCRQQEAVGTVIWDAIYLCNKCEDMNVFRRGGGTVCPLYTYSKDEGGLFSDDLIKKPNFNMKIVNQISDKLGIKFVEEKEDNKDTFAPIDLLDYIYAVLHSPKYRETYKEFLKTDFPRVPYPDNAEKFWQLVELGGYLRSIHLLENPVLNSFITTYPIPGTNCIEKVEYKDNKVWINATQYFENVPKTAWEFYIGGYQPAQKWLKDRKNKILSYDDITHYQKVIVSLFETDKTMKQIDLIGF